MNKKLEQVIVEACEDLVAFARKDEDEIMNAWNSASTDVEGNSKFRLSLSILLDSDKDEQTNSLAFGLRRKLTHTLKIPDPDQVKLDL